MATVAFRPEDAIRARKDDVRFLGSPGGRCLAINVGQQFGALMVGTRAERTREAADDVSAEKRRALEALKEARERIAKLRAQHEEV